MSVKNRDKTKTDLKLRRKTFKKIKDFSKANHFCRQATKNAEQISNRFQEAMNVEYRFKYHAKDFQARDLHTVSENVTLRLLLELWWVK